MTTVLGNVVSEADYWRLSSHGKTASPEQIPFKEWQHFVVFGPDWSLVFNLNLDATESDPGDSAKSRVITLFSRHSWHGEVVQCFRPVLRRGTIDAKFGGAGICWKNGSYHIWQTDGEINLRVQLQPAAVPSLTHNIPLGGGSHLSWCLIARLRASGFVEVAGEKIEFSQLAAYHDHNWGRFHWGGDFSWEWGCALPAEPEEPWTLVFARMNSKDRNAVMASSVFLLEHGKHLRYFRNAEVEFRTSPEKRREIDGRVPPGAALLLPDEDLDVPARTNIEVRRDDDWLRADLSANGRGQVLVPSEVDYCKVVRLNEATADTKVLGRCAGREVNFEGPGLLEVVCG